MSTSFKRRCNKHLSIQCLVLEQKHYHDIIALCIPLPNPVSLPSPTKVTTILNFIFIILLIYIISSSHMCMGLFSFLFLYNTISSLLLASVLTVFYRFFWILYILWNQSSICVINISLQFVTCFSIFYGILW